MEKNNRFFQYAQVMDKKEIRNIFHDQHIQLIYLIKGLILF